MKMKMFYLEADGLDSANIEVLMQSFQQLMLSPVAGDGQMVAAEATPAAAIEEKAETTALLVSDATTTIDWPAFFADMKELSTTVACLENGSLTWRSLNKDAKQALILRVCRILSAKERCTISSFDQIRPSWMPLSSGCALIFDKRWTELVRLAQQPESEVTETIVHEPAAPVALNGDARGHL